jgi:hypothetical protein
MAKQILSNARLWLDQFDMSGDFNAVAIETPTDSVEVTTIQDTQHIYTPGLRSFTANCQGLWEAGANKNDEILAARIRSTAPPLLTLDATGGGGIEGDRVALGPVNLADYQFGGQVGDLLAFSLQLAAAGGLTMGTLLHNATRSATANGTGFQLGALAAGRSLYAHLHLLTITGGGALTVSVQSAAANTFVGATTRGSFTAIGAGAGAQGITIAGPVTDTWWRIIWTLTGSSPTALFVSAAGIL